MPNTEFDPSQLADIHLPSSIGIWPIAPGWWILSALFVLLCVLIILLSKDNKKRKTTLSSKQLKSLALKELAEIENIYQEDIKPHKAVKQLSIFLRRFALSHYHREQVASLTDEQWLGLLDEMSDPRHQKHQFSRDFSELLTKAPYQSHHTRLDPELIKQLFSAARNLVQNYKQSDKNTGLKHV